MFLAGLGLLPVTSPNEGCYGQVAREMLERHDWVLPRIDSVVYFEKPPLLYWLCAVSMSIFGENAFAARLPSALAGVATVWLVFWFGRRLRGRHSALLGALVASCSLGFVFMARQVMFDALLTAMMTAVAVLYYMLAVTGEDQAEQRSPQLIYVLYAALALAVLAKGLIGILLPLLIMISHAALTGLWGRLRLLWHPGAIALFLLLAVPWHIAAAMRHPEFTSFYFVNEHLLRFLGRRHPNDFHKAPIYTPYVAILMLLCPWSIFIPAALAHVRLRLQQATAQRRPQDADPFLFLLCWAGVPLLFFTVSGTRAHYYMLPVVPPFALLVGAVWNEAIQSGRGTFHRRWLTIPLWVLLAVGVVLAIYCSLQSAGSVDRVERLAMERTGSGLLLLGCAAALLALRANRMAVAFACLTVMTMVIATATLAFAVASSTLGAEKTLADALIESQPPGNATVVMEDRLENTSAFVFYLPRRLRPALMVDGRLGGDLEFGSQFPEARRLFIAADDCRRLASRRPLYYLTADPPQHAIAPTLHPLHRAGRLVLWTNVDRRE
jgi:4-amino-4-deoxy-L-arabinose transferase-like glycosyltransferase